MKEHAAIGLVESSLYSGYCTSASDVDQRSYTKAVRKRSQPEYSGPISRLYDGPNSLAGLCRRVQPPHTARAKQSKSPKRTFRIDEANAASFVMSACIRCICPVTEHRRLCGYGAPLTAPDLLGWRLLIYIYIFWTGMCSAENLCRFE